MNNLEIWSRVSKPPAHALKQIGAGRLKGMTDVNPQWRIKAITESFGMAGVGWYYEIVKTWTEPGASGEVMAFVHIHLHVKDGESWSMPIVGVGGSALIAKESSGLRANDEAYKMALTDALSVAMKQLGVASSIYEGLWDGSKYKDEPIDTSEDTAALQACQTMPELQAAFIAMHQKYKGNREALIEVTAVKDACKKALVLY